MCNARLTQHSNARVGSISIPVLLSDADAPVDHTLPQVYSGHKLRDNHTKPPPNAW